MLLLQLCVYVFVQRCVSVPRFGAEVVNLIDLNPDGEIVGLKEFDGSPAVSQIGLHHQRIVVTLPLELRRERPGFIRYLQVASSRRNGQVDFAIGWRRQFLALPFFDHGFGEWLAIQGLCPGHSFYAVSYTHLRAHETDSYLVCRLLLEKKKK